MNHGVWQGDHYVERLGMLPRPMTDDYTEVIANQRVAIGLVVFDWKAWRGPAPAEATTPPQAMPSRGAAPATPA